MLPEEAILYEDADLLVVNKPSGVLVEGIAEGEATLQDALRDRFGPKTRPCHRLDRLTTGVTLWAKNARFNAALNALFEQKRIRKVYWAIVEGSWPKGLNRVETLISRGKNGTWSNAAQGKPSLTTFRILRSLLDATWLEAFPKTGRTRQIRLHCQHAGHPILGDAAYGKPHDTGFMALHARSLSFRHPGKGIDLFVEAPMPSSWRQWIPDDALEEG